MESFNCLICKRDVTESNSVILQAKGACTINRFSHSRGDDVEAVEGNVVHIDCRKKFTDKRKLNEPIANIDRTSTAKRTSRVSRDQYFPKTHCLFCGNYVDFTNKHSAGNEPRKVQTKDFSESIKICCNERLDEWSLVVIGRIEYFISDLLAAGCVYHQSCSVNFRTGRQVPQEHSDIRLTKKMKIGRPQNELTHEAFIKTCKYFESNDEEQLTVQDLINIMEGYLEGTNVSAYDRRHMKRKLIEHFGESIIISGAEGLVDVITLRENADTILRQYYKKSKDVDIYSQKILIIEAAAKIIKTDIKSIPTADQDMFPGSENLNISEALSYLPDSLKLLLSHICVGNNSNLKTASIGQCIMQSARPRTILAPLQIGLAVQLNHHFRSRYLLDTLHSLGFTASYSNVQLFERNAAVVSSISLPVDEKSQVLMVADNVDHNLCTLDGRNTIHVMGMMAAVTPYSNTSTSVTRRKIDKSEILKVGKISTHDYKSSSEMLKSTVFIDLPSLAPEPGMLNLLWEISGYLKPSRGQWSGMMQVVFDNETVNHNGKALVKFLPMIDLNPSDMSCILSTLYFLLDLAKKNNLPAIITFDQPLFWKASIIKIEYNELKPVVLLLGNFHTIMNLLGSLGSLMSGSGLSEVFEEIYASNTVPHMMTGKAYSRSIRGHFIVDAVLHTLHLEYCYANDEGEQQCEIFDSLVGTYDKLIDGTIKVHDLAGNDHLQEVRTVIDSSISDLRNSSRTARLWLDYQLVVATIRKLITADRLGSFTLLLEALKESLPFFAASGHTNYTKSVYLHLQNMTQLQTTHPEVYAIFQKVGHVIRRSDRNWAGLAPDMVIEQCLMRSLKTSGGLTRGSGMTETQRITWLLSTPVSSEYNSAMEDLTNVCYKSSEQHKDMTQSRMKRDKEDYEKVMHIIRSISPFSDDPTLRNIVTGVTAAEHVNVDDFINIGKDILGKMKGNEVFSYKLKRNDKAKTISSSSFIKLKKEETTVDPALLFQRFYILSSSNEIDLNEVLKYELCSYPPALFERPTVMLKAEKPQFTKALMAHVGANTSDQSTTAKDTVTSYVLDGGSLLHRLSWPNGCTYREIATSYATFVASRYGKATVVFDGYDSGPTIKDATHKNRTRAKSTFINFSPDMRFTGKKELFLSNKENKQKIINLIAEEIKVQGCSVIQAVNDADVDIALAAVESSKNQTTTVIGEDTDLLVLLVYWCDPANHNLFFKSDKKLSKENKVYDINAIRLLIGDELKNCLFFVHSYLGCDTTSRIFHIGKQSTFTRVVEDEQLRELALSFSSNNLKPAQVEEIGKNIMVCLFRGNPNDTLTTCRKKSILSKIHKAKSFVKPQNLPPTESATKYHSLRAYLQIRIWQRTDECLNPTDWGWKLCNDTYEPKTMDLPAAPEYLLKIVRCDCKTGCVSMRCVCRKNGFDCSDSCGYCQETNCENGPKPILHGEVENDELYV